MSWINVKIFNFIKSLKWIQLLVCTIIVSNRGVSCGDGIVAIFPSFQKVLTNAIVTMSCDTTRYDVPNMYFKRNGMRLKPDENHEVFGSWTGIVIRIHRAHSDQDSGVWECVMWKNKEEPRIASAILKVYPTGLEPKGFPKKFAEEETIHHCGDDFIKLSCNIKSDHPSQVYWLMDYSPVDMNTYRIEQWEDGTLEIFFADEDDEGLYECVLSNEFGIVHGFPIKVLLHDC